MRPSAICRPAPNARQFAAQTRRSQRCLARRHAPSGAGIPARPGAGGAEARGGAAPKSRAFWWGAASGGGASALAAALALFLFLPPSAASLAEAVADAHARALTSGKTIMVASSNHHIVKPWLAAHAGISPPATDFAAAGLCADRRPHRRPSRARSAAVIGLSPMAITSSTCSPGRTGARRCRNPPRFAASAAPSGSRATWILPRCPTWTQPPSRNSRPGARAGINRAARAVFLRETRRLHMTGIFLTPRRRSNALGRRRHFVHPVGRHSQRHRHGRGAKTGMPLFRADQRHPYRLQQGSQSRCDRHAEPAPSTWSTRCRGRRPWPCTPATSPICPRPASSIPRTSFCRG